MRTLSKHDEVSPEEINAARRETLEDMLVKIDRVRNDAKLLGLNDLAGTTDVCFLQLAIAMADIAEPDLDNPATLQSVLSSAMRVVHQKSGN